MKTVLFLLTILTISVASHGADITNSYAPSLKDVVVQYDSFEQEFSPFLFHSILGEALELKMDDSCTQVQVLNDKSLLCISKLNRATKVGVVAQVIDHQQEWAVYAINWLDNVNIVETQIGGKYLVYSLVVK